MTPAPLPTPDPQHAEILEDHEERISSAEKKLEVGAKRFQRVDSKLSRMEGKIDVLLMTKGMDPKKVVSGNPGEIDKTHLNLYLGGPDAVRVVLIILGLIAGMGALKLFGVI